MSTKLDGWKQLDPSTMAISDILDGYWIVFRADITPPFSGLVSTQLQVSVETCALTGTWRVLYQGLVEVAPSLLAEDGYYSPCFLVQKERGSLRPILRLGALNKFVA